MGIDIVAALKAIVALVVALLGAFGLYKFGKMKENKGRNDMKGEIEEAIGDNYKELAADVLDGGVPWRVRHPGATEVSGPGAEPEVRVAPDVHRNGGDGGSDGDAATTS